MARKAKWIFAAAIAALLAGFFLIPADLGNFGGFLHQTGTASGDTLTKGTGAGDAGRIVTDELQKIAELTVMEYDYKNATDIQDILKLGNADKFSIPILPTKKQIIMIYEGKIRIGVDAAELGINVDTAADGSIRKIIMTLPETKILSHEMNRKSFDYPLERPGFLNGISTEDYNLLEATARDQIEERVKAGNLFDKADEQLKEVLTRYLAAVHGSGVKVEFRKQKN